MAVDDVCCQAVVSCIRVSITRQEAYGTRRKLHAARLFRHTALPLVTAVVYPNMVTALKVMSYPSKRLKQSILFSTPVESIPWEWASQTLRPVQSISLYLNTFGAKAGVRGKTCPFA